jgi:hypothetical protein
MLDSFNIAPISIGSLLSVGFIGYCVAGRAAYARRLGPFGTRLKKQTKHSGHVVINPFFKISQIRADVKGACEKVLEFSAFSVTVQR